MKIDGNPMEKEAMKAFHRGDKAEGHRIQAEFLKEMHETFQNGGHCSCTKPCNLHGKCVDCVAVHRAHQEHLPNCFREMVNVKIKAVSELTEHSIKEEI